MDLWWEVVSYHSKVALVTDCWIIRVDRTLQGLDFRKTCQRYAAEQWSSELAHDSRHLLSRANTEFVHSQNNFVYLISYNLHKLFFSTAVVLVLGPRGPSDRFFDLWPWPWFELQVLGVGPGIETWFLCDASSLMHNWGNFSVPHLTPAITTVHVYCISISFELINYCNCLPSCESAP